MEKINGGKHITLDTRKVIATCLNKGMSAKEIASIIGVSQTTVSREIFKRRVVSQEGKLPSNQFDCLDCLHYRHCHEKKLCGRCLSKDNCKICQNMQIKYCRLFTKIQCKIHTRFPFVCNGCNKRISCQYAHYSYFPETAQKNYEEVLVKSRKGLNATMEEFNDINEKTTNGVHNGQSIYHIVNAYRFNVSYKTVYSWINKGLMDIKRMDLPCAVTFKPRKTKKKEYEYKENNHIDRSGRMYSDWCNYRIKNNILRYFQMDFLGAPKKSKQMILVLVEPNIHFVLLYPFERKPSSKVSNIFDRIQKDIGIEAFKKLFTAILTDRDSLFSDFLSLETSPTNGEERTKLFYCDPTASNQKGSVENTNKQLRVIFGKKTTLSNITLGQCQEFASHLNSRPLASLGGATPCQLFISIFGTKLLHALGLKEMDSKDVKLRPIK